MKKTVLTGFCTMLALLLVLGGLPSCKLPFGDDSKGSSSEENNPSDGNNPKDPADPQNSGNNALITSLKFDLSGAKAILAADNSSGGSQNIVDGRAVNSSMDVLYKVMEDDSVKPLVDLSAFQGGGGGYPRVKFIAHSPLAGKKDLYICFESDLSYWKQPSNNNNQGEQVNLGSFLHVKEDGTCVSIVRNSGNGTWSYVNTMQDGDPVAFDGAGNMYFTVSENSNGSNNTNVIYQYNPVSCVTEPLTAATPNTQYDKVALSFDGAYVVAKGRRWGGNNGGGNSTDFLRLIPTANPDGAQYIHYNSGGGSSIRGFALRPQTKEIYVSGNSLYKPADAESSLSGLFKVSLANPSSLKWTPLFGTNTYNNYGGGGLVSSSYGYVWTTQYRDTEGNPDYDKIMEFFYAYAGSTDIEFRFGGKTDRAALAKLEPIDLQAWHHKAEPNNYKENSVADILKTYWFRKGTNTPVTTVDLLSTSYYGSELVQQEYNSSTWSYEYRWKSSFLKADTTPDYDKIMRFFKEAALLARGPIDIEFRYNGKTDQAALAELTSSELQTISGNNITSFMEQHCFLTGSNVKFDAKSWSGNSYNSWYSLLTSGTEYRWAYRDADGNPDYDQILEALYTLCKSENIEFRYKGKTGKEAIASFTSEDLQKLYNNGSQKWEDLCYRPGTDTKVTVDAGNYSFGDIDTLAAAPDNSVWGTFTSWNNGSNRRTFAQFINSRNQRDFLIPTPFKNGKIVVSVKPAESHVYYCADVSDSGMESGAQNIYRFPYSNPDSFENLFEKIPRNINNIEVFSYAIGGDYLYFGGTQGTKLLTGKIHLATLKYTELEFGHKITAVVSY